MGMDEGLDYRALITSKLAERKKKNASYSLRAFSKSVSLSPGVLSEVLAGKRELTLKSAVKLAERIQFSDEEKQRFLHSVFQSLLRSENGGSTPGSNEEYLALQADVFRNIADWYHYAILSLARIQPNSSHPRWISGQLGISQRDAKDAFARLSRLNLIRRQGSGFVRHSKPVAIETRGRLAALQNLHRQNLHKALHSLDNDEIMVRDFSSITMAIDADRIEEAREFIKRFRRSFSKSMETGEKKQVYTLAVQLFPVSKKKKETK